MKSRLPASTRRKATFAAISADTIGGRGGVVSRKKALRGSTEGKRRKAPKLDERARCKRRWRARAAPGLSLAARVARRGAGAGELREEFVRANPRRRQTSFAADLDERRDQGAPAAADDGCADAVSVPKKEQQKFHL